MLRSLSRRDLRQFMQDCYLVNIELERSDLKFFVGERVRKTLVTVLWINLTLDFGFCFEFLCQVPICKWKSTLMDVKLRQT